MTNIVDFNNSDGLPPWVIQKLNNNFWNVVYKILDDQVVMVAGVTEPTPRTDETLWYKTDTGDLYIWREFEGEWGWDKIDIGYIHVDDNPPGVSSYQRENEFLWIDKSNSVNTPLYLWVGNDVEGYAWWNIRDVIYWFLTQMSTNEWLNIPGFVQAVQAIHNNPNGY